MAKRTKRKKKKKQSSESTGLWRIAVVAVLTLGLLMYLNPTQSANAGGSTGLAGTLAAFGNFLSSLGGDDASTPSTPAPTNVSVDRFLQVIAYNESRGNPLADAPGSTATGKYQYIYDTWNGDPGQENGAKYLFPPAIEYAEARDAPEAVQDAVAYIEYSQKFRDLGNDLFSLAISHFYPRGLTHPEKLDEIIGNNTVTPRQYANILIDGINSGEGADIQLHYNEAPDFQRYATEAGVTIG